MTDQPDAAASPDESQSADTFEGPPIIGPLLITSFAAGMLVLIGTAFSILPRRPFESLLGTMLLCGLAANLASLVVALILVLPSVNKPIPSGTDFLDSRTSWPISVAGLMLAAPWILVGVFIPPIGWVVLLIGVWTGWPPIVVFGTAACILACCMGGGRGLTALLAYSACFFTVYLKLLPPAPPVGTLEIEMRYIEDSARFEQKGVPGRIELVQMHTKYEVRQTGTGLLEDNDREETVVDDEVTGIDTGGHHWMSVAKSDDGGVLLTEDTEVISRVNGEPFAVKSNLTVAAEFVSGSWDDLAAGRPAELRLTKDGAATWRRAVRDTWKRAYLETAKQAIPEDRRLRVEIEIEMDFEPPVYALSVSDDGGKPGAPVVNRIEFTHDVEETLRVEFHYFEE